MEQHTAHLDWHCAVPRRGKLRETAIILARVKQSLTFIGVLLVVLVLADSVPLSLKLQPNALLS